jgi:hypothetical protein
VITHTGYDMIDPEVLAEWQSYVHVPPADCEIKIYESNNCVQRWRRCVHVTVIGSVGFSAMTDSAMVLATTSGLSCSNSRRVS